MPHRARVLRRLVVLIVAAVNVNLRFDQRIHRGAECFERLHRRQHLLDAHKFSGSIEGDDVDGLEFRVADMRAELEHDIFAADEFGVIFEILEHARRRAQQDDAGLVDSGGLCAGEPIRMKCLNPPRSEP